VGTSDVTGGGTHGYIWHDDNSNGVNDPGEMKDLNSQFSDANWTTLVEARSINDGGQIIGWGHEKQRRNTCVSFDANRIHAAGVSRVPVRVRVHHRRRRRLR
jgi:hypothetical protein